MKLKSTILEIKLILTESRRIRKLYVEFELNFTQNHNKL